MNLLKNIDKEKIFKGAREIKDKICTEEQKWEQHNTSHEQLQKPEGHGAKPLSGKWETKNS